MWTLIMEILTSLKKEREVVDCVLQGCVGQYVLDGDNVVFRVPQLLACRVENDVHQVSNFHPFCYTVFFFLVPRVVVRYLKKKKNPQTHHITSQMIRDDCSRMEKVCLIYM